MKTRGERQILDFPRSAAGLKANLKKEGFLRRLLGPFLLAKALSMAYRVNEVESIGQQTRFAGNCRIEPLALAGIPIWMHIQLTKNRSTP